ncbi:MAG: endopeptidase La [Firmicutes bacterium]|nr:endopeptidase La [Bacillota bacterium]
MDNIKRTDAKAQKVRLPVLPLRGLCIFPYVVLHLDVGRKKSIAALEHSMIGDQQIFLVSQTDDEIDDPKIENLYSFGTISKVKQLLKLPGGNIRVLVEGISRGKLLSIDENEKLAMGEIRKHPNTSPKMTPELEAMTRTVKDIFDEYLNIVSQTPQEFIVSMMNIKNPGEIADLIASNIFVDLEDKMQILQETNVERRVGKLIVLMQKEMEIARLRRDISDKVKTQISKSQREYYLREQVKVIQKELGDKGGIGDEVKEYKLKIAKAEMPAETKEKLISDAERLLTLSPNMPDSAVLKTYLDTVLSLPWNTRTKENQNLIQAKSILDRDHFGLDDVKERILEFLAVRQLAKDVKGPILCLIGPPGVGKTSIAKSIAKALKRKYARMSLGGVRDEADIRGHRKTYIGAMPGRIINAVRQAKSKNAMILLDEIDKMGSEFRGDPASAMLEVLDSEQNYAFTDHYIEVPFDLSDIMFIMTANSVEGIPRPLFDRMEVINLSSYTVQEKIEIAVRYLIPKQRRAHGITAAKLRIRQEAVDDIINFYTKEAGVRELERQIATICRKSARKIIEDDIKSITINSANIELFLGNRKYNYDEIKEKDEVGVATGLAWTQFGGDTLQIETNVMHGKGDVVLTGQLGDVMKESAQAAISYIRSVADLLGIEKDFYKNNDIHIHVPDGATPKDGPSAGITIAISLISALTGYAVKKDVAMTGEITLRGRILPVGGIKEKVLAAFRAGITSIIIPLENEKDLKDIPDAVAQKIKFIKADSMNAVIETSLAQKMDEPQLSITDGHLKSFADKTGVSQ